MRPIDAQERLSKWLRMRGIDTPSGPCGQYTVRTGSGEECLLWLPEHDVTLFIFIVIAELTIPQDNGILALTLALNLEPSRTRSTELGYNSDSRQLMLRSFHPVENLDEDSLNRILLQMGTLADSLKCYVEDYRRQAACEQPIARGPAPATVSKLKARFFNIQAGSPYAD